MRLEENLTEFWEITDVQKVVDLIKSDDSKKYTAGLRAICDEYQRLKSRIMTLEKDLSSILHISLEEMSRESQSKKITKIK